MSDHAPLSPSASAIWMNCPGGAVLNDGVDGGASEASAQGTVAHAIGYAMLTGLEYPAAGMTVKQDGFDIEVDAAMIGYASEYADYVRSLGGWQRYEQRVSLEWLVPGVWGTADAGIINVVASELHIVDFKYGAGVYVPVFENWQLLIYALGLLGPEDWYGIRTLTMHVHQPRMNNVKSWTISIDDVANLHEVLVRCVNDVRAAMTEPLNHLSPGDHCRWCPQRSTCTALQSHAITVAQANFGPVETLPAEVVGEILDQAELIDLWVSAVRAEAYKRAERGECPGWKLVPKRPSRVWTAEVGDIMLAGVKAGVNTHGPAPVLSPAQMETAAGKKKYAEHFAPLVASVSSGLKLVRESDPARAVKPDESAAIVFGAVSGLLE